MGREPPKSVGIYSCSAAQLAEISTLTGGAADVASAICSTIDVNAVGTTNAVLQWTVAKVAQQSEDIAEVVNGLNTWFVLSSAYNVFVMQVSRRSQRGQCEDWRQFRDNPSQAHPTPAYFASLKCVLTPVCCRLALHSTQQEL